MEENSVRYVKRKTNLENEIYSFHAVKKNRTVSKF